jgi:hypothetical protein
MTNDPGPRAGVFSYGRPVATGTSLDGEGA